MSSTRGLRPRASRRPARARAPCRPRSSRCPPGGRRGARGRARRPRGRRDGWAGRDSRRSASPSRTSQSSSGRLAPGRQCAIAAGRRTAAAPRARDSAARGRPGRGSSCGRTSRRADPDLEQGRLMLPNRPVPGRGERADPRARPDERKPSARLGAVVEPVRARAPTPARACCLALGHPRMEVRGRVLLERAGRDLVREPHPLDLLLGLDRACRRQQQGRVDRLWEAVEPGLRVRRRLPDHPVRRLRAEAQARSRSRS